MTTACEAPAAKSQTPAPIPQKPAAGLEAPAQNFGAVDNLGAVDNKEQRPMVPFFELKTQYERLAGEIREAIDTVLANQQYILGPAVAAFESDFAAYCEVPYAAGVNSGPSALQLALLAAGVGPGDEVITVPFTFIATAAAVRYVGARPVFVDIEPATFNIDVTRIEAAITSRTKAILPVHLFGQSADMDPILAIARQHGLAVIEDCAQAHGATYKGKRVGGIGDFGCFSFYPTKNLGAAGEGGMVPTSSPAGIRTLRMMRDWGQETRGFHDVEGFNMRLEGIQGAVLGVKFRYLEEWNEKRRAHAAFYREALADSPLVLPVELPHNRHVYNQFAVRAQDRDAFRQSLLAAGVNTAIYYSIPVHLQKAHADLGYGPGSFPVAEAAARQVVSLPLFPELTEQQREAVAAAVHASLGRRPAC